MIEELFKKKSLVEKYLAESKHCLSAFSFVNIFGWQDFFTFEFKEMGGNLCIFARDELGVFQYLPPLGKNISAKIVEESFAYMRECNGEGGITRIENIECSQIEWFNKEKYNFFNKGYEYCYYKKDIVSFRGNRYKSKRAEYNVCVKQNSCQYRPFKSGMLEECGQLYWEWMSERQIRNDDGIYKQMLQENKKVHQLVLQYHKDLDLIGRVVVVDGEIKAYTFGFPLNKFMFCVLFEIVDLSINGLATYIFREFCQDKTLSPYQFINVMDDFELKNIKETKMSFRPVLLFPSYGITRK